MIYPIFKDDIWNKKDAPHKQTIQRDDDKNITEDTDMHINRDKKQIKKSCEGRDVKQIRFARSGRLLQWCSLPVNHCIFSCSLFSLSLTVFAIVTIRFTALTEKMCIKTLPNRSTRWWLIDSVTHAYVLVLKTFRYVSK